MQDENRLLLLVLTVFYIIIGVGQKAHKTFSEEPEL